MIHRSRWPKHRDARSGSCSAAPQKGYDPPRRQAATRIQWRDPAAATATPGPCCGSTPQQESHLLTSFAAAAAHLSEPSRRGPAGGRDWTHCHWSGTGASPRGSGATPARRVSRPQALPTPTTPQLHPAPPTVRPAPSPPHPPTRRGPAGCADGGGCRRGRESRLYPGRILRHRRPASASPPRTIVPNYCY